MVQFTLGFLLGLTGLPILIGLALECLVIYETIRADGGPIWIERMRMTAGRGPKTMHEVGKHLRRWRKERSGL